MCAAIACGAGTDTAAGNTRLIMGVCVGNEDITAFQGADNMLMSRAVDNDVVETKMVVHAASGTQIMLKELFFSVTDGELSSGGPNLLGSVNSDCFDLLTVITPGDANNIELAARWDGNDAELMLRYNIDEQKLYVTKSGEAWQGVYEPEVHLGQDGKLRLRLMMDKICYDIFGNGGEAAIQGILYTQTDADGLMIRADGNALIDYLEIWSMAIPEGGINVSRDSGASVLMLEHGWNTYNNVGKESYKNDKGFMVEVLDSDVDKNIRTERDVKPIGEM